MLHIPETHQLGHLGDVFREQIEDIDSIFLRRNLARCLIWASSELAAVTRWPRERREVTLREIRPMLWEVDGKRILYLDAICDSVLYDDAPWRVDPAIVMVLVPFSQGSVFRTIARHVRPRDAPYIWSLDDYLSYRSLMAHADAGWSHRKVYRFTTMRFRHHIRRMHLDRALEDAAA